MKHMIIALLVAGIAFGTVYEGATEDLWIEIPESPLPGGSELPDNPEGTIATASGGAVIGILSDADPGTPWMSPVEKALFGRNEEGPSWPGYDWGDDAMIYPGEVVSGQDFDVDQNTGDIYAILDNFHSTNDSVIVYRSQDGGETWVFWRATYTTGGPVFNPKIRVAIVSGGQTWVCMIASATYQVSGSAG